MGGVPAKQIETIEEYYSKIKNDCVPAFSMTEEEKRLYLFEHRPDLFAKD